MFVNGGTVGKRLELNAQKPMSESKGCIINKELTLNQYNEIRKCVALFVENFQSGKLKMFVK